MSTNNFTSQELISQINELKQENNALKLHISLQEKYKNEYDITSIIDNIGYPIFVKDNESRLILVNDAFCKMFKTSRANTIGKTLAEEVDPKERDEFLKIDHQVISDGLENINEERLTLKDSDTRVILTRKTRFINPGGNKFIIGVVQDITDSHHAKNALKKSEKELKILNQTKDKLFSIIAHDLRSPFNNILGIHELLAGQNENFSKESKEYLSLLYLTAKNTIVLLDNLLNWAKSQTGQINFDAVKLSLTEITDEIIELENPIAKTNRISLSHNLTNPIIVKADKNMLMVILRNLFYNAIKFTNSGGEVKLSATLEKNFVKITVSDNGIGIEKETLKNLFTSVPKTVPYNLKNKHQSGLGLLLCKEFVEIHKGKIWVESELDKGSQFHFTLPL